MDHTLVKPKFHPTAASPARAPEPAAKRSLLSRLGGALRRWWQEQSMDDLSLYLSHSESAADLEYRLRRWNEHDRRGRMPLL
jgi:hypothetical protein